MKQRDPKLVVLLFNESINNQNIDGLASLMSEDHVFVDSSDEVHQGKELMVRLFGQQGSVIIASRSGVFI